MKPRLPKGKATANFHEAEVTKRKKVADVQKKKTHYSATTEDEKMEAYMANCVKRS
jgi:hypothetical protein